MVKSKTVEKMKMDYSQIDGSGQQTKGLVYNYADGDFAIFPIWHQKKKWIILKKPTFRFKEMFKLVDATLKDKKTAKEAKEAYLNLFATNPIFSNVKSTPLGEKGRRVADEMFNFANAPETKKLIQKKFLPFLDGEEGKQKYVNLWETGRIITETIKNPKAGQPNEPYYIPTGKYKSETREKFKQDVVETTDKKIARKKALYVLDEKGKKKVVFKDHLGEKRFKKKAPYEQRPKKTDAMKYVETMDGKEFLPEGLEMATANDGVDKVFRVGLLRKGKFGYVFRKRLFPMWRFSPKNTKEDGASGWGLIESHMNIMEKKLFEEMNKLDDESALYLYVQFYEEKYNIPIKVILRGLDIANNKHTELLIGKMDNEMKRKGIDTTKGFNINPIRRGSVDHFENADRGIEIEHIDKDLPAGLISLATGEVKLASNEDIDKSWGTIDFTGLQPAQQVSGWRRWIGAHKEKVMPLKEILSHRLQAHEKAEDTTNIDEKISQDNNMGKDDIEVQVDADGNPIMDPKKRKLRGEGDAGLSGGGGYADGSQPPPPPPPDTKGDDTDPDLGQCPVSPDNQPPPPPPPPPPQENIPVPPAGPQAQMNEANNKQAMGERQAELAKGREEPIKKDNLPELGIQQRAISLIAVKLGYDFTWYKNMIEKTNPPPKTGLKQYVDICLREYGAFMPLKVDYSYQSALEIKTLKYIWNEETRFNKAYKKATINLAKPTISSAPIGQSTGIVLSTERLGMTAENLMDALNQRPPVVPLTNNNPAQPNHTPHQGNIRLDINNKADEERGGFKTNTNEKPVDKMPKKPEKPKLQSKENSTPYRKAKPPIKRRKPKNIRFSDQLLYTNLGKYDPKIDGLLPTFKTRNENNESYRFKPVF